MTDAVSYADSKFYIREKSVTPGEWEEILQLIALPALGPGTPDNIDITTLASKVMESIPALPSPGEMTFEFRAAPYTAINSNTKQILDLDQDKTYEYMVQHINLGIQATWEGMCVSNLGEGGVNAATNITLTTMISGMFILGPLVPITP
jgi:hypothetical protein